MSDKRSFDLLSSSNWGQWADNMEAYLSTKELWEFVDGSTPKPTPADASKPTAAEAKELEEWKRKAAKASGEIWLAVEDSQKVHIKEVKGDPAVMWAKLEGVHLQKKPGTRFNAYEVLFSIRKAEEESLSALMARADKAMQDIKALRPSGFTIKDLDQELQCMALIRSLPLDYNNFASSLLLLYAFDLPRLQSAFQNEEAQRTARHIDSSSSSLTLHTTTSLMPCFFCEGTSHFERDCEKKKKASEEVKKNTALWKAKGRGGRGKGGKQGAKEATQDSGNSAKTEFAGQASALSSSDRATWLQTRAATDWNPDTGATSHMTPHRHWFRSYSPHLIPVRLADNSVIYSAGKGSVEFQPKRNGVNMRPVVFHDVLHVPKLSSNLLSLLHLACQKGYKIIIEGDALEFIREGKLLFTATVNEHNVGYLNGYTIVPQSANISSTCPLDLTLWHRRCSHLNFDALKSMHSRHLVTGMEIRSKTPPDPICEPCILGKQRRHNIPQTATRRTSLLGLVHTDLKGPLPVQTPEGYRYWQPFIDDKSRFRAIAFLKRKSDALPSFKQYKAENKLGCKIQVTRDDKGGEFIGK